MELGWLSQPWEKQSCPGEARPTTLARGACKPAELGWASLASGTNTLANRSLLSATVVAAESGKKTRTNSSNHSCYRGHHLAVISMASALQPLQPSCLQYLQPVPHQRYLPFLLPSVAAVPSSPSTSLTCRSHSNCCLLWLPAITSSRASLEGSSDVAQR